MARQDAFTAGELAPELHSRTSLAQYGRGLRRCRNFVPLPLGALRSRPGTRFVGITKDEVAARLVPFVFSDAEACVLEFGNLTMRVVADGGLVESSPGVAYVLATPYALADVAGIRFVQEGDTLILTHPAHPPRRLTRTGATAWAFDVLPLAPQPAILKMLGTPGSYPVDACDWVRVSGVDPGPNPRNWHWAITSLNKMPDGTVRESRPFLVTKQADDTDIPEKTTLASDHVAALTWGGFGPGETPTVEGWRIYRGEGTRLGFLAEVGAKVGQFEDNGAAPDYSQPPPSGVDYFAGSEHPAACGFFEQRLVLASAPANPDTLWGSSTSDYFDFDRRSPANASDPYSYELASHKREAIRWLVGLKRLLIGTASSIWSAERGLGPTSVQLDREEEVGTADLEPIVTGRQVLYVRSKGSGVRALAYSNEGGGFQGTDLSVLASHLFRGRRIVSWAWQEDPHGLVWAALDDGRLLSLTYRPDLEAWGWAWHDTQGEVVSVACIPEGDEDALYLVVRRAYDGDTAHTHLLERMDPFALVLGADGKPDPVEAVALDQAITYRGAPATLITGLVAMQQQAVWAVADGFAVGPLTVDSGGTLTLDTAASVVHVGRAFTPELETLDLPQEKGRRKVVQKVRVDVVEARGLQVGESEDDLHDWQQRDVTHGWGPVPQETRTAEVEVSGSWNTGGRVFLRQVQPFPVTVTAIERKVVAGGED